MKYIKILIVVSVLICNFFNNSFAQDQAEKTNIGFYFNPHFSPMFLDDHVGRAVGFNLGITSKNRKWAVGVRIFGRSGPINEHQEYELILPEGVTFKGKSTLLLGADHVYAGLEASYNFRILEDKLLLRIPASFGQVGAGFYHKGEDRITPDGRRVSEWEDELQEGNDAGFGLAGEIGVEGFYTPFEELPYISFGGGIHFTKTFGYTSFLGGDDFYNDKIRLTAGMYFSF